MPVAAEACLQDAGVRRGCWRAFAGRGAVLCAAQPHRRLLAAGLLKFFVFLSSSRQKKYHPALLVLSPLRAVKWMGNSLSTAAEVMLSFVPVQQCGGSLQMLLW